MRAPITDKQLFEMMWKRFPEIMKRATEQPAPVQQERMAWVYDTGKGYKIVGYNSAAIAHLEHGTLLVPNAPQPAQRTWVGLTDEDIRQCSRDVVAGGKENSVDRFAYAIEAKLKEKNT